MSVRAAEPKDAAWLARLHVSSFEKPWSSMDFHKLLSSGAKAAIAHDVGFILWRTAGGEAEILTLAVEPAYRRRGLAAILVAMAIDGAGKDGAETLFLEVADDNTAAIALYTRAGFRMAGVRKGYYPRAGLPAQDALVLRRALNRRAPLRL